ncbi:MAG: hypothetical protein AAF587_08980 [Bacteroidota bacterium]
MLFQRSITGDERSVDFQLKGILYSFTNTNGLTFNLRVDDYHSANIAEYFHGKEERALSHMVKELKGMSLPFMELEFPKQDDQQATISPPPQSEQELLLTMSILDPDRAFSVALALTDEDGDNEWILPRIAYDINNPAISKLVFSLPILLESTEEEEPEGLYGIHNRWTIRLFMWTKELDEEYYIQEEIKHRRYELFRVAKDDSGKWGFADLPEDPKELKAFWKYMSEGKSLLLIHGTHGTSSIAFKRFMEDKNWMDKVEQQYGERIISFNHPSVIRGVKHNVKKLKEFLDPIEEKLDIDILTRSRGCLIARYMIEKDLLPPSMSPQKLVMLSGPNQGTPSALARHWPRTFLLDKLLKRLAEKSSQYLENEQDLFYELIKVKSETLALLETEDKSVLQGAEDQALKSKFILELNKNTSSGQSGDLPTYYMVTTSFDPDLMKLPGNEKLKRKTKRKLKRIFGSMNSDAIVPTLGSLGKLGSEPISRLFVLKEGNYYQLADSPDTHHINLPDSEELRDKILEFLLR